MNEVVMLKCRCGNSRVHAGPKVDLAEFLRCAIGDGWRRIDEEPLRAVECAGSTEIELYGQCANCTGIEDWQSRALAAKPPRRFKTLHERSSSRSSLSTFASSSGNGAPAASNRNARPGSAPCPARSNGEAKDQSAVAQRPTR